MKILFITRRSERCGVADYGKRLFNILATAMDITMCECDEMPDLTGYDIALYNYHYATMPFITTDHTWVKHIALFHEAHLNHRFDKVIPVESLPRPLFNFSGPVPFYDVSVIGSFGFGFPSKNFPLLATKVKKQFDKAILRLNIPFAEFGDADGILAKGEVEKCNDILKGSNIELQVSHEFLNNHDLLNWCRHNSLNAFLYEQSSGRGLSSCIDYALSARKPIAVSNSEMFRHLPQEICIDNFTMPEIINKSIRPLYGVYEENSNEKLVERILKELVI